MAILTTEFLNINKEGPQSRITIHCVCLAYANSGLSRLTHFKCIQFKVRISVDRWYCMPFGLCYMAPLCHIIYCVQWFFLLFMKHGIRYVWGSIIFNRKFVRTPPLNSFLTQFQFPSSQSISTKLILLSPVSFWTLQVTDLRKPAAPNKCC